MSTVAVEGPSGGELGRVGRHDLSPEMYRKHPGLARQLLTLGARPRAGHDRARWETVTWEDYRAHVGIQQRRGPWSVQMVESRPDGPDQWMSEACSLPWEPGWYTALVHDERGLVMSDLPAEVAGALPFLDHVAGAYPPAHVTGSLGASGARVLVGGLGLGIVPAWLLANTNIWRLDVIEIDPYLIDMIARDPATRDHWARNPRLHVHRGDVHTWWPQQRTAWHGCALHTMCSMQPDHTWDAAFFDIWDTVSAGNLPSMHRLHRRFARRTGWQMSWERAECEAMRRRGQTVEHPGFDSINCLVLEDGYA